MQRPRVLRMGLGILLAASPFVVALVSLAFGRYYVPLPDVLHVIATHLSGVSTQGLGPENAVIWDLRLPRALLAVMVGAGLAVSGASFQALFTNPLATPDTLGVGAGATFGAVLAIMLGLSLISVQIFALIFGALAVGLAFKVGVFKGRRSIISIILAGIVIVALFQALISLMKYLADPQDVLPSITYWIMGSFARANYPALAMGAPFCLIGIAILYSLRWRFNLLSLDEDEAMTLGVNVKRLRALVILACTMVTASCVSLCGQVGWVGLVVPHMARMLVGSDNKKVVPVSIALGAVFVLIIDTVARTLTAAEIPISVLTALIGAPVFIYLLKKTGGSW